MLYAKKCSYRTFVHDNEVNKIGEAPRDRNGDTSYLGYQRLIYIRTNGKCCLQKRTEAT